MRGTLASSSPALPSASRGVAWGLRAWGEVVAPALRAPVILERAPSPALSMRIDGTT
eukprot:gene40323-45828_t